MKDESPPIDIGELLQLAHVKEKFILESEKEMRGVGQIPDARPTEDTTIYPNTSQVAQEQPTERKLSPELHDRLGPCCSIVHYRQSPSREKTSDVRKCHSCDKIGHLARNCSIKPTTTPQKFKFQHKTEGHMCEACGKLGHT